MFPSCLPLSFNAKVLAKDIFLLLRVFQHSVLHCGLGSPALTLDSVSWPGPFMVQGLENPRDGRAWWATVYGVAQSRTQLK